MASGAALGRAAAYVPSESANRWRKKKSSNTQLVSRALLGRQEQRAPLRRDHTYDEPPFLGAAVDTVFVLFA